MKNILSRFLIVALLAALTTAPWRAEGKVMVVAALDNSAVATPESQAPTNVGDMTNVPVASASRSINVPAQAGHRVDLVGLVAVVLGCSIPIVIVSLVLYFNHRRNRMVHETVRAMIEKGLPVTPELVTGLGAKDAKEMRPRSDLRRGLVLAGVGAGLVLLVGKPGWIVFFLGVAFLVVWLVERKNQNGVQPPR